MYNKILDLKWNFALAVFHDTYGQLDEQKLLLTNLLFKFQKKLQESVAKIGQLSSQKFSKNDTRE